MRVLIITFLYAFAASMVTLAMAFRSSDAFPPALLSSRVGAQTYDVKLAMSGIFFSKSSSCTAESIASWTCEPCKQNPGVTDVSVFTERDTQSYVAYDSKKNKIVVVVRGSSNVQNWIDNLTFEKVPYLPCKGACEVHKGFYEVYQALASRIVSGVQNLQRKYPSAGLFVTGHSLGAAISTHAALDLSVKTGVKDLILYNTGSPRVGDGNFSLYATNTLPNKAEFRQTHAQDPVPHLPLKEWGFRHVPHEIFFNNNGNTSWVNCVDSAYAEDPKCSDQFPLPVDVAAHQLYLGIAMGCKPTTAEELAIFESYQ